jgi:hypothetical protein
MADNHPIASSVLLGTARGTSPTDKGIRHEHHSQVRRRHVRRSHRLAPREIGTITVDRVATVDDDLITLAGCSTCSGVGDRIGSLSFEILMRDGSSTDIQTVSGLSCDGAPHWWHSVAHGSGRIHTGTATFWGSITVCEPADGPCPTQLIDQRLTLKPAR